MLVGHSSGAAVAALATLRSKGTDSFGNAVVNLGNGLYTIPALAGIRFPW